VIVRRIAAWIAASALSVGAFLAIQNLLVPKYMSGIYEGALIGEYYAEPRGHDIVFIGDCEVYETVSPVTLWEEYGITSYIRGGPQQLIWHSYYLLKDALKYEKPRVAVFNILSMQYDEPQSEAYNRLNLDGMRLSPEKLEAASVGAMPGESALSYAFPILRFHDRWSELTDDDFTYYASRRHVSVNGYVMRADIKPVGRIPEGRKLADYSFGDKAMEYLDKMRELCEENGVELMLMKAPTIWPHWYDQWEEQTLAYAEKYGLIYVNLLADAEKAGIDFATDTYDAGLHTNVYGAEKCASYLGQIMRDSYGLPDRRGEPETAALWAGKTDYYNKLKSVQEKEFAETGKISTLVLGE
jgi:hypothetical protein